jgi:hypothetical protein
VVIGKARFAHLPAGKASKVSFKLNATGRRLLKRGHGRLSVTVTISYTSNGKTTKAKTIVRLHSSPSAERAKGRGNARSRRRPTTTTGVVARS